MAMSLSAGGGGMGGAGLGSAAMAYQAPGSSGMPSQPQTMSNPGASMMKSSNVTTDTSTPEEDFRSTLPVASLDLYSQLVAFNEGGTFNFKPGKVPSKASAPFMNLFEKSLRITRNEDKSYKAFKKYSRKGHTPGPVFEKCLAKEKFKDVVTFPVNLWSWINQVVVGDVKVWPDKLSSGPKRGSILVDLHDDYEPIVMTVDRLLGLFIHGVVNLHVKCDDGCILNVPLEAGENDEMRTWVKMALDCTDFVEPLCPGSKKSNDFKPQVLTPDRGLAVVTGSQWKVTKGMVGGPELNREISRLLERSKLEGKQAGNRPPCSIPSESPMVLTFTSTKKSISCSVVMLSQLTSMGKNKDGQPIPLFCKLAVVTKVVHLKEATEKLALESIKLCAANLSRAYPNRGVCCVYVYDSFLPVSVFGGEALKVLTSPASAGFKQPGPPPIIKCEGDEAAYGSVLFLSTVGEQRVKAGPEGTIKLQDVVASPVGVRFDFGNGKSVVKPIFDFDRAIPSKYSLDLTAAEVAWVNAGEGREVGDADPDEDLKEWEHKKNLEARKEAAKNLRIHVVQRKGRGDWQDVPMFEGADVTTSGKGIRPLSFTHEETGADVQISSCTFVIAMDCGGICSTRMIRERIDIESKDKIVDGDKWIYYKIMAVIAIVFAAISYRSYKVTVVFDYNTKKLHTFYRHVKPKGAINPLHEARILVYEYQDKEKELWAKLEKKYGEKVLEPYDLGTD
ncbi:hypothetical protein TL16_g06792 [Triparma laevis f. inornata]|uniref:Uncharacterized protein n=1 Tax=Triparma laevis f. inornata TaxID=1714386 RepID=A0A9W7ANL9_9STRA|nr:hypothetical protein TL16_g06792 [Triparma laevis f. inornata]